MIKVFRYLVPKGYVAITIFPFIFVRTIENKQDVILINHEKIHLAQQKELLVILFYIAYLFELIFKGYKNISFEKEAYNNEKNLKYLEKRRLFAWKYDRKGD